VHVLLGLALALGGCSESDFQSAQTIVFGEPDELSVQPIRVCKDDGSDCAQVNLFADITAKILKQANLKLSFLPTNQLNATRFLSINDRPASERGSADYEFYELTRTGSNGAFGRHPDSTDTSGPINIWYVDTIEALNGFTQFGLAWVGANGVIISKEALEFGTNGRTDIVAHEIGHNLGLRHETLGAGGSNNLLTDGDRRNVPNSVDDINPDGAKLSALTNAQIAAIKQSPLVTQGTPGTFSGSEAAAADAQLLASLRNTVWDDSVSGDSVFGDSAFGNESKGTNGFAISATDDNSTVQVPEPSVWVGLFFLGLSMLKAKALDDQP